MYEEQRAVNELVLGERPACREGAVYRAQPLQVPLLELRVASDEGVQLRFDPRLRADRAQRLGEGEGEGEGEG